MSVLFATTCLLLFTLMSISLDVRETKRGMEEFTSDIPNVSEEATKDLDDNGIVRVGARIEPGDILIGKISPKGESRSFTGGEIAPCHLR